MKNSIMQPNPLSGVQSLQQAPSGIQGMLAQYLQQQPQQAAPAPDQSSLGDYIKQLQDNGATTEQIQDIIGQMQGNGGQMPQSDTMQGGEGADTIEGGSSQDTTMGATQSDNQSPFSKALNQMASGQGNINYDQVSAAYPTPRSPIVQDKQQLIANALMGDKSMNGSSLGAQIGHATSAANQAQVAQQQAVINALNQRDLGAFGATTGIAEKAGNIASQRANIDQRADWRANQLDMAQARLDESIREHASKEDIAQQRADIAQQRADMAATGNKSKPLSADMQKQLNLGLDQFIGVRDAKGNTLDLGKDIDPTQKNQILAASASYLQQNPNVGVQGALGHVINEKLGGVNNIQDATSSHAFGLIGNDKARMFPQSNIQNLVSGASPQTAPNVSTPAAPEAIPTGGQLTVANPNSAAPSVATQPISPKSRQEYDALPSGTKYVYKDGSIRTKP